MHFQPSAFIYLHLYSTETFPCCQQGTEARFLKSGIESWTQIHGIQMTSTAPSCQNTATFAVLWQKLLHWEPLAAWLGPSRAQFPLALICSDCGLPSKDTSHGVTVRVQLPPPRVGEGDMWWIQQGQQCHPLPCSGLFVWAFPTVPLLQSIVPPAVLGLWLENRSLFWSELKKNK